MEHVTMPGTGLSVSRICLGTMTFGGQLDEQGSLDVMKYALEHGIDFFDTADIYERGNTEPIVGKGLAGIRDQIVLASKVGGPSLPGANGKGLSRKHILASIDQTLSRLGTDYLDIFYLHFEDLNTPLEETLGAMDTLVRQGKVRYAGISNHPAWKIAQADAICEQHGFAKIAVTESRYNLLTRAIDLEVIPFARERKLGITVYNPIAGGLLSGKHTRDHIADNSRFSDKGGYYKRYWSEANFAAMDELTAIAEQGGMTLIELAQRWCLSNDAVTSVITGASKLEHLAGNLELFEKGPLPQDMLAACDEVWGKLSGNKLRYTD